MTSPLYSIVFSAVLDATSATVALGQVVIQVTGGSTYVVATSANRGTRRATGIALRAGNAGESIDIQQVGQLDAATAGLGAGAASWLRVSTTGVLERVTPSGSDDVVGYCETDGTAHLIFGFVNAVMVGGSTTPSGSGFRHVTSGVEDSAAVTPIALADGGFDSDIHAQSGIPKLATGAFSFVAAPAGAIVGTSDSQALTNKTIAYGSNTITGLPLPTDLNLTSEAQGCVAYYNGSNWVVLAPGTSGMFLETQGASANPTWATIPTPTNLSLTSQAQGDIAYFNGTAWVVLAPGTSGQFLETQGASANPQWASQSTVATDLSISSQTADDLLYFNGSHWARLAIGSGGNVLTVSGGVPTWAAPALPSNLSIASEAQGDVIYYNGSNWVRLAAGSSGYFLKTQGAGANPVWAAVSAAPGGSNTYVQFNDGSAFNGEAHFTYTKTTGVVAVQADGTGLLTVGSTVAGTGDLRVKSAFAAYFRTAANSADKAMFGIDASDNLFFGSPDNASSVSPTQVFVNPGQFGYLSAGNTTVVLWAAASVTITGIVTGTDPSSNTLSYGFVAKELANAFTTSTTASLQSSNLTFAMGASDIWVVEFGGTTTSAANTSGVKFGIAIPTGATIEGGVHSSLATGLTTYQSARISAGGTATAAFNTVSGESSPFWGSVCVSGDGTHSGSVTIQLQPGTTTAVTMKAGSWMRAWRATAV